MLLFNQGYYYIQSLHFGYVLLEDSVQNSRQWSSNPLHPSGWRGIRFGRLSIKQHPSGWRELSIRTLICVQKLRTVPGYIRSDVSTTRSDAFQCSTNKRISFPNTDMGRQLQPSGRRSYFVRTLSKRVATIWSSVYTVRTLSPYYENCVQQKCNRLDAKATLFGRGSIQERISANLESRLHSCPFWRSQLPSGCRLEKIDSDSRFKSSIAYK
jgi:hypothetical protein